MYEALKNALTCKMLLHVKKARSTLLQAYSIPVLKKKKNLKILGVL